MQRPYRKWIQKTLAALLAALIGIWFIGIARDATRNVLVEGISVARGKDGQADPVKQQVPLRQFIAGIQNKGEGDDDGPSIEVWKSKSGEVPSFDVQVKDPMSGKVIKGFSRWITWLAFSRAKGVDGLWYPAGKPFTGKSRYVPGIQEGNYLLLAVVPPFDLGGLSALDDEALFKILLQGANQDRRQFAGLVVTTGDEKKSSGGSKAPKQPAPPPVPQPQEPPKQNNVAAAQHSPTSKPASPKGDLSSKTKGESDQGSLAKDKEGGTENTPVVKGALSVPPRKDSSVRSLQNLAKLKVEGALPEINVSYDVADFSGLTHDEIKQLDSKYGVAVVLQPSPKFANMYREGFAVIDPTSGEVSDQSFEDVMVSLGRKAIPLSGLPGKTVDAIKGITKTNAWLHWDGGYGGLHFGNALLVPFQEYLEKNPGGSVQDLESLDATLSLHRSDGGVGIVASGLVPKLKEGVSK